MNSDRKTLITTLHDDDDDDDECDDDTTTITCTNSRNDIELRGRASTPPNERNVAERYEMLALNEHRETGTDAGISFISIDMPGAAAGITNNKSRMASEHATALPQNGPICQVVETNLKMINEPASASGRNLASLDSGWTKFDLPDSKTDLKESWGKDSSGLKYKTDSNLDNIERNSERFYNSNNDDDDDYDDDNDDDVTARMACSDDTSRNMVENYDRIFLALNENNLECGYKAESELEFESEAALEISLYSTRTPEGYELMHESNPRPTEYSDNHKTVESKITTQQSNAISGSNSINVNSGIAISPPGYQLMQEFTDDIAQETFNPETTPKALQSNNDFTNNYSVSARYGRPPARQANQNSALANGYGIPAGLYGDHNIASNTYSANYGMPSGRQGIQNAAFNGLEPPLMFISLQSNPMPAGYETVYEPQPLLSLTSQATPTMNDNFTNGALRSDREDLPSVPRGYTRLYQPLLDSGVYDIIEDEQRFHSAASRIESVENSPIENDPGIEALKCLPIPRRYKPILWKIYVCVFFIIFFSLAGYIAYKFFSAPR